jgi:hypothetical protein
MSVPFDTVMNEFLAPVLLFSNSNAQYQDIGTSGISAAMDLDSPGQLHIVYFSSQNTIIHASFTYNSTSHSYTPVLSPTQISGSELANHPVIAVSPTDNSITVAWVSGINGVGNIYAKTRYSDGLWTSPVKINSADVWTSPNSGLNIDQGPSLVISADGERHLIYIENWRVSAPFEYGRIHYCTSTGSSWTDQFINAYSHDPVLAMTLNGDMYILGHGHPQSTTSISQCKDENTLCVAKKVAGSGSWSQQTLVSTPITIGGITHGFDSSASVKWSTVGWNSPDTVEFAIFSTENDSYSDTSIWYGRL